MENNATKAIAKAQKFERKLQGTVDTTEKLRKEVKETTLRAENAEREIIKLRRELKEVQRDAPKFFQQIIIEEIVTPFPSPHPTQPTGGRHPEGAWGVTGNMWCQCGEELGKEKMAAARVNGRDAEQTRETKSTPRVV